MLCLVGKNATGKSAFLNALAKTLSGLERGRGVITPAGPMFSRVIVIAYSAFDSYSYYQRNRPKEAVAYCGLRDENGRVDLSKAFARTEKRLNSLRASRHYDTWRDVVQRSGILDTEVHLAESFHAGDFSAFVEQIQSLSTGHQIILFVLSNLIATIRPGSMILFDEPDLHLHPNLLSSLMRLLHAVLDDFQSYAILATHSPQIVQEIPARSVRIIERHDAVPSIRPYPRESFGANLGEIINLAFGIDDRDANYQRILTKSARTLGHDWFMRVIDNVLQKPLSLAPYALLHHLRQSEKDDEEA